VGVARRTRVLGWAPVPRSAGWGRDVGTGGGGVNPGGGLGGGGQGARPFPAGWHFQDSLSGVGDQAGRCGQDPKAQGFGGGFGQLSSSARWRSQAVSVVARPASCSQAVLRP
jgi:hypothetical protein